MRADRSCELKRGDETKVGTGSERKEPIITYLERNIEFSQSGLVGPAI